MEMVEKLAYLKGLTEGLGLDESSKEGKVLRLVIDLLDDVVLAIADVGESFVMMGEELESIEEDMEELLEDLYGYDNDDCCCCGCSEDSGTFEGELYEVICPACADIVCVDEDMLDEGEINCPGCGQTLEFDLEGAIDSYDLDNASKQ